MAFPLKTDCVLNTITIPEGVSKEMPADVEQPSIGGFDEASAEVLRGHREVLDQLPLLMPLAEQWDQVAVIEQIDYYISRPFQRRKRPCLVLLRSSKPEDRFAGEIFGAVLLYEFELGGRGTGIFATDDKSGTRTVLGPPASYRKLVIAAMHALVGKGAHVILISYQETSCDGESIAELMRFGPRGRRVIWANQTREMRDRLILQPSFEATLAEFGKHTRRNLRYYRRKAEEEFGCEFVPDITGEVFGKEFSELVLQANPSMDYEVVRGRLERHLSARFRFISGLRAADGRWLSCIAGRRVPGETVIDWQINHGGYARASLCTVMRSYFLENEVALGSRTVFFEEGTPHTMELSFEKDRVVDLILRRESSRGFLTAAIASRFLEKKSFLAMCLLNQDLEWHRVDTKDNYERL
jgi:hypothetical protein